MVLDYEADMSLDWSTYQLSILSACRTSSFCDRKWVFWHWLHNPTQWEFLLYNPTQWEALSVTENRCVYTDYTMRVLTTQSYTMRVLFVIKKNRCVYTDYTILVPTQREFFCLWHCLHDPMQWELLSGWPTCGTVNPVADGLAPGCERVKGHFSVPILWVSACADSAVHVLPLYKFTVCTRTSMH